VTQNVTINRNGTPTVVGGLYIGSVCTVTETNTDGGNVTYAPAGSITIVDAQAVTVVVTNTYPTPTATTTTTTTTTTAATTTTTTPVDQTTTTTPTTPSDQTTTTNAAGSGATSPIRGLPSTGSNALDLAIYGGLIMLLGSLLIMATRRRKHTATTVN